MPTSRKSTRKPPVNPLNDSPSMSDMAVTSAGVPMLDPVQPEPEGAEYEKFSFACSARLVKAVRVIAHTNELTIRQVIDAFLTEGVRRYEQKHGKIVLPTARVEAKDLI